MARKRPRGKQQTRGRLRAAEKTEVYGSTFARKRARKRAARITAEEESDLKLLQQKQLASRIKMARTNFNKRSVQRTAPALIPAKKCGIDLMSALGIPVPNFSDMKPFVRRFWAPPTIPSTSAMASTVAKEAKGTLSLNLIRKSIGVQVIDPSGCCPPPVYHFHDPHLPNIFHTFQKANRVRFERPTRVQQQAWPAILAGANVLAVAPTGSGKTLAYLLPALTHMNAQSPPNRGEGPLCLVLVPTRELAAQVCSAFRPLGRTLGMRSLAIYGGGKKGAKCRRRVELHKQGGLSSSALGDDTYGCGTAQLHSQSKAGQASVLINSSVHLVAATPGRALDLIALGALKMGRVSYLVVDEADRMLTLGFEQQLDAITQLIRPDRQTVLFSATFPETLRAAGERWLCSQAGRRRSGVVPVTSVERSSSTPKIPPRIILRVKASSNTNRLSTNAFIEGAITADIEAGAVLLPKITGAKKDHNENAAREIITLGTRSTINISADIVHCVQVVPAANKGARLIRLIEKLATVEREAGKRHRGRSIIFCNTRRSLRSVVQRLLKCGAKVAQLHGKMDQEDREQSLNDVKCGKANCLVATDVAARGLHLNRLAYVINYDFPRTLEQYAHRVGRTGRQGQRGRAYTFITPDEARAARALVALLRRCRQVVGPKLLALSEGTFQGFEGNDDEDSDGDKCLVVVKAAPDSNWKVPQHLQALIKTTNIEGGKHCQECEDEDEGRVGGAGEDDM
jgi:superfamily II DNA/RNA helicase